MPIGRQISQLAKTVYFNRDTIYAGLTGTATGISASATFRDLEDAWINKHKWYDPFKPKRGKGDIVFENDSPFNQTLRTVDDNTGIGRYHSYSGNSKRLSSRRHKPRTRGFGRSRHKSCLCRTLAYWSERQRKWKLLT